MDKFTDTELVRLYWLVTHDLLKYEQACSTCKNTNDEYCEICGFKLVINELTTIRDKIIKYQLLIGGEK